MKRLTLAEARELVGRRVIYRQLNRPDEHGVITRVSDFYVFVRYDEGFPSPVATDAGRLLLESS